MLRINKPLRIAETDNNMFLLSVPKTGKRFEINTNVADFIKFIQTEENFDFSTIEKFTALKHIGNTEDYKLLVRQMIEMNVLVET
ncbi:MAG: hypothetical protein K2P63_09855 [Lachnospiraceae bacterium]|nr:hypothetical protein [Lachnospiraceae bacterium]